MTYIDQNYYKHSFGGTEIPDTEFDRLAEIASILIFDACYVKPDEDMQKSSDFKRAVAYQAEMLHAQGGISAVYGFSEASMSGTSESLGSYSISSGGASSEVITASGGIPISSLSIMLLIRLGLRSRWAYAGRRRHGH